MSWTTPATRVTGELMTASSWNTDVRDNLNYLYGLGPPSVPSCLAYSSVDISVPDGTDTALLLDSALSDTDSMFTASSTEIIIHHGGTYMVGGSIDWEASTTGLRVCQVRVNGSVPLVQERITAPGTGGVSTQVVSTLRQLSNSDYIELVAAQSSGGALHVNFQTYSSPVLWAVRVGE